MAILRTPSGRAVKVIERGEGTTAVFPRTVAWAAPASGGKVFARWPDLRHVPHAEHSLVDGAGHMLPLTHAAELTRILVAWAARRRSITASMPERGD